jgi:MFS family permease
MSADATLGSVSTSATQQERKPLGTLIAISIFWFALNFHWGALLILLIPDQVIALLYREAPPGTLAQQAAWVDANKPLTLALVLAPGLIVALIANPLFGLLSDRTPGRFGRRRPYILGGTLLNIVGLLLMAFAPIFVAQNHSGNALAPSILVLTGALMLVQLANNSAAAPFHALLPDLVPREQRGFASGIMGLALLLGQIGGVLVVSRFGSNSKELLKGTQSLAQFEQGIIYGFIAVCVVILLMAVLTVIFVREKPWDPATLTATARDEQRHTVRDLTLTVLATVAVTGLALLVVQLVPNLGLTADALSIIQLLAVVVASIGAARAFGFRPRKNPDFSWVVLTRMLVVMGVQIVQTFLTFYMKDVVHADSPEDAATLFVIILTLGGVASTLIAGWASDRIGRKRMVYISGGVMAAVGAAFIFAPYLVTSDLLTVILIAGAIFGLGYGAYLAVDWALVADVLPSEETFARDMGVWNIGLTLPQVLAAVFGGWLIGLGLALGSLQLGYTFLFVGFVVFCVSGTVTVRYVKGVAR